MSRSKKRIIKKLKQKIRGKKYVKLKCKKCGKVYMIRTNKPEIYTDKVRKKWVCLLCKT